MKPIRAVGTLSITTGLLVAIGCTQSPGQSAPAVAGTQPPMGVTNAQSNIDSRVVEQIGAARCDHEQKCDNIGPGKKFSTRSVCADQSRSNMAQDINAYDCPRGVAQEAFQNCLRSIQQTGCNTPLTQLFAPDQCSSSALCIK